MEEARVRSPSEESGLVMQPLRDRTASFGMHYYYVHAYIYNKIKHTHTTFVCMYIHINSVAINTVCLYYIIFPESGHEDNEDEIEEGNPAMMAGDYDD